MSDNIEVFRIMREASLKKRASNREYSTQLLQDAGVSFTTHNRGAHLRVQAGDITINFWPGTGLWRRPDGSGNRGVKSLLKEIQKREQ